MAKRGNPAKPERESMKEDASKGEEKGDKKMAPWMGKKGAKKACK